MEADFRDHPLFKMAETFTAEWLRPGSGQASALAQVSASPDGRRAVATASICDSLDGPMARDGTSSTRIAFVDLETGEVEIVTHGPRSDSMPAWSPDGRSVAFISDREQAHIQKLRILDAETRADRTTSGVGGFVESLEWSSDGTKILLGVAGYGSDLAGPQGAVAIDLSAEDCPGWMPSIRGAPEAEAWRSLWLYDVLTGEARQATPPGLNIWEGVWCGPDHVVAICSDQPGETWWYSADIRLIEIATGAVRRLYRPRDQLGWLTAAASGRSVAVVEAVCSDRGLVAGDVRILDLMSGAIAMPDTLGVDVVQMHWRDERHLLFVGGRGPETVIGLLDTQRGSSSRLWSGFEEVPSGAFLPEIAPLGSEARDVLFLRESFFEPPTLTKLQDGQIEDVCGFGSPVRDARVRALGTARDFAWQAPDGLEVHGWLITPPGSGPFPLIMQIHGGPVMYTRPMYLGRTAFAQMALAAGYALFQPNPRGSSGSGQAFARYVFGDMGGADTHDFLSGLDALETAGIADRRRIGVTGGSYGGFMTAWLITQDQRFAAAVPVAPTSNWVSDRLTSNVPTFCDMFLADRMDNPAGRYFARSPIYFAKRVKTPTLNICGALDQITHPGQALEFHNALQIAGAESVLLTYREEGHGVRSMPAIFDYSARMLDWFSRHMPE